MRRRAKTYWQIIWEQFLKDRIGTAALLVALLFFVIGLYAPILASSKPLFVIFDGEVYFPLFRYLFYSGFYTKRLDIFFNLLMFALPLALLSLLLPRVLKKACLVLIALGFIGTFTYFGFYSSLDPASNLKLVKERQSALQERRNHQPFPLDETWEFDLKYMTSYAKLNLVLDYRNEQRVNESLTKKYGEHFAEKAKDKWLSKQVREYRRNHQSNLSTEEIKKRILQKVHVDTLKEVQALPTLAKRSEDFFRSKKKRLLKYLKSEETRYVQATETYKHLSKISQKSDDQLEAFQDAYDLIVTFSEKQAALKYLLDRQNWLKEESENISYLIMPLFRIHHWEDDVGGLQALNSVVSWWEVARSNSKDLAASLIFGVRVSLMVGVLAVAISLLIGLPIGVYAGYYGGKLDIGLSRILEIWEALPVFFMLLFVVAITQSKSIFLVVAVLGIFGWTGFARFIRGEVLKQRNLSYVLACRSMGFNDRRIMFSHILPNAIPPVLTLVPFSIMAAMTSEAGLSFLGLGEEGSASWGVLMDEGRQAFPGESYLLWPPAIMLTILLVAVALIGNSLRDAFDPKMHKD